MSKPFLRALIPVSVACCLIHGSVFAQTADEDAVPPDPETPAAEPSAKAPTQIEEIVVTARRKEESLQSTPVAVSAVTEEGMKQAQIDDIADVQRAAPNLTIGTGAPSSSAFTFVSLRGQQNLQTGVGNDPAVGVYIDGVYLARPSSGLFDLNDVQRVEVLRGPQGTLFGRNTIGGALNLITNQPDDVFAAWAGGELGDYSERNFHTGINVPMGDRVAARLVYHHREHDGFGENVELDQPVNDLDKDDFVRLQVRVGLTDAWDLTLSGDWNEMRDSGQLNGLAGWTDSTGLFGAFGINLDPYLHTERTWYISHGTDATAVDPKYVPFDDTETYGFSARIEGSLGWADFKSITSWRSSDSAGFQDLDGTPEDILWTLSSYEADQFAQELQLSGGEGKLSWIGGLYYFGEEGEELSDFQALGFLGTPAGQNLADVENTSYAGYLQTYYQITDALRGVAGFRYTWDERDVVLHNTSVAGDPATCNVPDPDPGAACSQTQNADFDYPSWTLGLDYQINPDLFVYTKTSAAYMAGGWNLRVGSVPAFDPQRVIDVEFGAKADWLERRLRTNVAVFHAWQSDVQRNVSTTIGDPPRTTEYVRNAGDAQISGLELESKALLWEGMEVNASLGLLAGEYDSGSYTEDQEVVLAPDSETPEGCTPATAANPQDPRAYFSCRVDRSDEELLQLPDVTFGLGATQSLPLSFGTVSLHADYAYLAAQTYYERTAAEQQPDDIKQRYAEANGFGRVDGYGLFNARAALSWERPDLEVAVWGRNLTDEKYGARAFPDLYTSLGTAIEYVGQPRTYGLSLLYRFGH